jgi:alkanesulfonate monooxygenase SsuD/methylene tetrahydromethanopterin reductase-like flavin-dependent oxidoreductase (luciferase family)
LRHPVPVALQVAQLDQLSGGRFVLGIGVGGEDPHEFTSSGVDPHTRGARTNEAMVILKRLWTEDHVTFDGKHYQLDDVTLYPKPFRPVPIFVGGRSDAALRRAARLGDGYTGIWLTPERFREAGERIAEVATAAGRDPGQVELGMQYWTSVSDSRETARDLVARGMQGTYKLPFERFERYTPFGAPEEMAEYLAPFVAAGARHINLIPVQESPEAVIEAAVQIREALHAISG